MKERWRNVWPWLLIIALLLLSPFASKFPDGLERVAHDLGFITAEQEGLASPMPDYTLPFLGDGGISTILAGAIGAVILVIIFLVIDRAIKAHK